MSINTTAFIAFGHRCSAAAILDRCGLSAESLPFDAVVSQLRVVKDCLETEFREFLDPRNYVNVATRTVNRIDGEVQECCTESPNVNRYYEEANRPVAGTDLTNSSTYHLQLALTHHDLSRSEDYELFARRIGRLQNLLKRPRRKVYLYIHPILGADDFSGQKSAIIDDFTSFSEWISARYANISGLFFILVKLRGAVPEESCVELLKRKSCSIYLVYTNNDFIDAGAPFAGNREQETEAIVNVVKRAEFSAPAHYKVYFPRFDHIESNSNEMRLTHEGLLAHPQVTLVDRPEIADYLIFCQNHLVNHCPFHVQFGPIKDKYKEKTILLDYDDSPRFIYDADDFRWRLYFKRSCVDREAGKVIDYGALRVLPTAYCAVDDMCDPPLCDDSGRTIDLSCLFDDNILDSPYFMLARGRLLKFAKRFAAKHDISAQIGTVSDCGPVGRSRIDPNYKRCLYKSKIVLHANPDHWEGDSRLWEALASGALVFVDRMFARIKHKPIDGEHLVFFDLTDEGLEALEQKLVYYLANGSERARIGAQGREFVLAHHRSIHRANEIIHELECSSDNVGAQVASKVASKLDIIVSIAVGYTDVGKYRQFISTLRRSGATCPIFLGIFDGPEYEPVKKYLLENAVNYFIVSSVSPPSRVQNGLRFALYKQWLRDLDFRYALMLDFRDVYFQRDPFADIEHFMRDCDLYLMSEFQLLTIGNHPNGMNYDWIEQPFGKEAADALADRPILNCGAILGNRHATMKLLDEYTCLATQQDFAFIDQGTLNYMYYGERLGRCGRIKVAAAGKSLVNNCGFSELPLLRERRPLTSEEEAKIAFIPRDEDGKLKLFRDQNGWVLDDDGNISHVVHQFDRFRETYSFVTQLSDFEYADSLYVRSKSRPYRGEKYTLSSRTGLKPSAVERLISQIKSLSANKKPLLALDGQFRRGFAFSYGVLNIDLLFEAEDFRQNFFEPTFDAHRRMMFFEKWDYELLFVEEDAIFQSCEVRKPSSETMSSFRDARAQAERWAAI